MKRYFLAIACMLSLSACNDIGNNDKSTKHTTAAMPASPVLEPVYSDSAYQLIGIAKKAGSPLYICYPHSSPVYKYAVVAATGATTSAPYPNEYMNLWQPGQPGKDKWVCVQSVYYDDSGTLWVLDPSAPMEKGIQGNGCKLVRMNADGKPGRTYSFTGLVSDTAYLNDVRIDAHRQFAYITNSKEGGILVVNLTTGKARQVLQGHPSVKADTAYKFIIDGRELVKDGKPVKINSDGIALSPDGAWLYYKPLTDDKLYRVRTYALRDWNMDETAIESRVEDLGHFTTTGGMICDKSGNLYLGDLQHYRIVRIDGNNKMTTIIEDKRLIWPDSYAIAEGYLYVSCSQMQLQPEYNGGINKRTTPYTVYRIKL